MQFTILGSSSSGNASLIRTQHSTVLIDAGFSAKKLGMLLQEQGVTLNDIDAIFITHEHIDHVYGLQALSKYSRIQVFTNASTQRLLQPKLTRLVQWQLFETGSTFRFQDLEVHAFSIPHDAMDPVGYRFRNCSATPDDAYHSLAWVTDLGHAPELIRQVIGTVDILVLEANYEPELLEQDTLRPWSVKQRIRSRHGHLSNQDAYSLLASIDNPSWKQVYLAHLSQHCNDTKLVEKIFSSLHNPQFTITIIDPAGTPLAVSA